MDFRYSAIAADTPILDILCFSAFAVFIWALDKCQSVLSTSSPILLEDSKSA
jgi:hypothetical protein